MDCSSAVPVLNGTAGKQERLDFIEQLIAGRNLPGAAACLRDYIRLEPMDSRAFRLLAEVKSALGEMPEAKAAECRSQQLKLFENRTGIGHALERYTAILEGKRSPAKVFPVGGHKFSTLRLHRDGARVLAVGCSIDGTAFLKVLLSTSEVARSGFNHDVMVMQHLSEHNCVSSPKVLLAGALDRETVLGAVRDDAQCGSEDGTCPQDGESGACPFVLLEYARADRGGFGLADVLLALLEQRNLGIYHDQISLRHVRFDSVTGVCRLTGYHYALILDDTARNQPLPDFWQWCLQRETRHCASGFLAGLKAEAGRIIAGGRLNLAHTSLFSRQRIAAAPAPDVQQVDLPEMFLKAAGRALEQLSGIGFKTGERVLEIGCGTGLISRYLGSRGCTVTGIESHQEQVHGARILNNLSNMSGRFLCLDLDHEDIPGEYDTVCLLTTLHHFWDVDAVIGKVRALNPGRLIIEASACEQGHKWMGRWFQKTRGWSFDGPSGFSEWIENRFPEMALAGGSVPTRDGRYLYVLERRDPR